MECFNRDPEGQCLAYTSGECSEDCPARIIDIDKKIKLVKEMLTKANAKKLRRELNKELKRDLWIREMIRQRKLIDWAVVYFQDLHRGSGGGQSESDSNRKTGLKQLMKDNRPVGIKPTQAQLEEYQGALSKWEADFGKLPKLSRSQLSSSKIDLYTGLPVCISDKETGVCVGQYTQTGKLRASCKECPWLKEEGEGR